MPFEEPRTPLLARLQQRPVPDVQVRALPPMVPVVLRWRSWRPILRRMLNAPGPGGKRSGIHQAREARRLDAATVGEGSYTMTDDVDRAERDRERRNAGRYKRAGGGLRGTRRGLCLRPHRRRHGVDEAHRARVSWRWSHVARAARVEVQGLSDCSTHPALAPADLARGLGAMVALLGDHVSEHGG